MDSSGLLLFTSDHCHRWKFSFNISSMSQCKLQLQEAIPTGAISKLLKVQHHTYLAFIIRTRIMKEPPLVGGRSVSKLSCTLVVKFSPCLSGSPFGVEFCSRVKGPIIPMTTIQYRFRFIINSFSANSNVISSHGTDFYVIHSSSKGQLIS